MCISGDAQRALLMARATTTHTSQDQEMITFPPKRETVNTSTTEKSTLERIEEILNRVLGFFKGAKKTHTPTYTGITASFAYAAGPLG